MSHLPSLPWRKINDYLLELSSASSLAEFFTTGCKAIQRLIPYDNGCIFTRLDGFGVSQLGYSQPQMRNYNDYYLSRIPYFQNGLLAGYSMVLSWNYIDWKLFRHTEFFSDFARPIRLGMTMTSIAPERKIFLDINRSSSAISFSETEKATLDLISRHIDNLYACFTRFDELSSRAMPTPDEIVDRFPVLSKREAEVLAPWIRGFSSPIIASRLFIEIRTVESHVAHIYDKLNARSRRDVLKELKVS